MFSPRLLEKLFLRKLFALIRKYGISLVIKGIIEFARTSDEKDKPMHTLADDLELAIERYKKSKQG